MKILQKKSLIEQTFWMKIFKKTNICTFIENKKKNFNEDFKKTNICLH